MIRLSAWSTALLLVLTSFAGAQTWNQTAGGSWNTAANWTPNTVPNVNTAAVIMPGTTTQAVTLDAAITVNSITFSNTALGYTISNGSGTGLTLDGTTPFLNVSTAGITNTISATLAGTVAWSKTGSGILALTGTANTFSGNVTVSAGTLSFNQSGAFSTAGTNSITLAGATLQGTSAGVGSTFITSTHKIIVNGTGTIDLSSSGAVLTYGSAAGDISPLAAGTGTLTKSGPGTFRMNTGATNTVQKLVVTGGLWQGPADTIFGAVPASALADAITLNGGGISLNAGVALNANRGITLGASGGTFNASSSFSTAAIIAGTGTLTKTGANVFTVSGVNTYTGATTISAGTMTVSSAAGLGATSAGTTVAAGAALTTGSSITIAEPLTLNGTGISNAGALRVTANSPTFSGAITLGSTGVRINADAGTTTMSGAVSGATFNLTYGGAGTIAVTGVIGTTTGSITKDGTGTLILSAANTYTGNTTVSAGVLTLTKQVALYNNTPANWTAAKISVASGAAMNFFVGGTGEFTAADIATLSSLGSATGGFLSGSAFSLDTTTLGAFGSFAYAGNFADTNGGANLFTLAKSGVGTVVLSGTNTNTGAMIVTGGTLQFAKQVSLFNNNNTFWNAANIIVNSGATLALNVGGAGEFTATDVATLTNLGTATGGFKTGSIIGLDTTNAGGLFTIAGFANPNSGANVIGLTKIGPGTLNISSASSYSGPTTIFAGTLQSGVDNSIGAGGLVFGDISGNAGTLDLQGFNQNSTTLNVNTSSNTNFNTITIAPTKTLNLSGNVVIGPAAPTATQTSRMNIGGGGTLLVATAAGGLFQVGGSTSGTTGAAGNASVLDLTGLAAVTINVSATGTIRVNNPQGGNTVGVFSTLLMPTPVVAPDTIVATFTAANLNVGDNGAYQGSAGQINTLTLGTGLTTLNVNTINIGTGGRDYGAINFASGNGTLVLRSADGGASAVVNIGTGTANTGVATGAGAFNSFDMTGHSADLIMSALNIGAQNRNSDRTDVFAFDTGTLTATTVVIGIVNGSANASAASNTWTSNLNVGGGTVVIGSGGVDIANRNGVAVSGTDTLVGNFNISGGTVTVANNATLGGAIRLSSNTVTATVVNANGNLNVTGGSLTVEGNIVKGSSTGAGTGTVTLNGGMLDLGGNAIGATGALLNFNLQSGTLRNLSQYNGGAGLVKTTGSPGNTVTLAGINAFTGGLTINDGIVVLGSSTAIPASNTLAFGPAPAAGTKLQLNGFDLTVAGLTTNASPGVAVVESGSGTAGTDTLTVNTAAANTFAGVLQNGGTRALALTKDGAGTLTLGGTAGPQTYTGSTSVLAGTLKLASAITGTSVVNVSGGATLDFNNGAGNPLTALTAINLGAGAGTTNLTFQLGSVANSDTLQTALTASAVGNIAFTIRALPGLGLNSYTLLAATGGGLTASLPTYSIASLPVGFAGTLSTVSDTAIILTITSIPPPGNLYWKGGIDTTWTTVGNFTNDLAGTLNSATVPGPSTTVIFSSQQATNASTASTTIESDSLINNLIFNNETAGGTITQIAIGTGANPNATLTIAPSTSTVGITVQTGAPVFVTINTPLVVGAAQTWSVADAGTRLTLGFTASVNLANAVVIAGAGDTSIFGTISGAASLTKIDGGILTINSVNNAYSGVTAISGGTVLANAPAALGTGAVSVSGGALLKAGATSAFGTGALTVSGGGTADVNGNSLAAQTVSIAGTGLGGNGALVNTGVQQINALRFLTLAADATVGGAAIGRFDVRANPTATVNFGGFNLTKTGANEFRFVNLTTVSNPGNVNVNAGNFVLEGTTNLGGTAANKITVAGGALFGLSANTNNIWTVELSDTASFTNITGTSNWAGPVTILGAANAVATIDAGGAFTLSGNISGAGGFNKTGPQALTLTGNNTHSTTGLAAGTLNINSTTALGSGPFTISGASTINNSTTAAITLANNIAQFWNADFTFTGTQSLNMGTGQVTINANRQVTVTANTLSIGGIAESPVASAFNVTKAGTGTLAINGSSTYTGNTILTGAGRLTLGATNAIGVGGLLTVNANTTLNATTDLSGANALPNGITLGANLTLDGANAITFTNSSIVSGGNRTITNVLTGGSVLTLGNVALSELAAAAARTLTITTTGSLNVTTTVISGAITDGGIAGGALTVGTNGVGNAPAPIVRLTAPANTFSGGVTIFSGALYISSSLGLGTGTKTVTMTNGTNGQPEFHMDGTSGDINLASTISFTTSTAGGNGGIHNDGGNNTINGAITLTSGGGQTNFYANAGTITFAGAVGPNTNSRTLNLRGNGDGFITSVISGSGANIMPVLKDAGTGSWTFSGVNTYSGATSLYIGSLILGGDAPSGAAGTLGNATSAVLLGNVAASNPNTMSLLTNGNFTVGRPLTVQTGTATISASGDVTIGSTVNSGTSTFSGAITIGNTANTTNKNVNLTSANGGTVAFNGAITLASGYTGTASLTKVGQGDVILAGTNAYNGTTTVSAGVLRINGNNSGATGAVNVNAGSLRGSGTIGGAVSVASGATIQAGNAVETLTLNNGLTLGSNATLGVLIADGSTPAAAGTGGSTISLPNPTSNNFLNIIAGGAVINSGTLVTFDATGVVFTNYGATYSYQIAQGAGDQSALNLGAANITPIGVDVVPTSVSLTGNSSGAIYLNFVPLPEPAFLLSLAAIAGLALRRRR